MGSLIKLENISKSFYTKSKNENKVLHDINLEIQSGDMVAVTGESGSGKTTLLNILGCHSKATSGAYFFNGVNTTLLEQKAIQNIKNEKIGFVIQDYGLLEEFNVYDNIELPLLFNKNISYTDIPLKVFEVLKKVSLHNYAQEVVENLSGGQKQRIAIARAVVMNPPVLIADEPTGALDIKTTENVLDLFKRINKEGTTLIIATHNSNVSRICNREIRLNDGRISW